MSYDLMVFEIQSAPKTRESFLKWYEQQAEWEEDHDYDDPKVSSPALQSWFHEMKTIFPVMNGPYALADEEMEDLYEEQGMLSEYCCGEHVIYVAFAWSQAEKAYETMRSLAKKHQVGFFDASGSGSNIILPDGTLMK